MNWRILGVTVLLLSAIARPAAGAPLFSEAGEPNPARDALARLVAKGLVEGYPDGTFKGDRVSTRYESAMLVARLVARATEEHGSFASPADQETIHQLAAEFRTELEALGVRCDRLAGDVESLDRRVEELERITFEGDLSARFVSLGVANTGRRDTDWGADVGTVSAFNPNPDFTPRHKFGTVDLLTGRPLFRGEALSMRMRLGVKARLTDDLGAGVRFAGYTSQGDALIDAYWGTPAPYLMNPFASNSHGGPQGSNNTPWTRLALDSLVLEYRPLKLRATLGSIRETQMGNFVLARTPNPNISGKSMAAFAERIVTEPRSEEVVTLRYREDEETYLPFFGFQAAGEAHLFSDMRWEVMGARLPCGLNAFSTAGGENDVTDPRFLSVSGRWRLGDQGSFRLDLLQAGETPLSTATSVSNHGNYWFWTDPASFAGQPSSQQPMRGNAFVSQQGQTTWGASLHYRFDPSGIRTVASFASSAYRPNMESGYLANGQHFRLGAGWTNPGNDLRLNLEYLATDASFDPFQLYFQPLGGLQLGGLPPGSPLAFAVVPTYYGGFPGSYMPLGYQLHDSGLYPNNRNGLRCSAEYLFPKNRGSVTVRMARLVQDEASIPHLDITGKLNGMRPGFIDPVFTPLRSLGTEVAEAPKGTEALLGGEIRYWIRPQKLQVSLQYDYFGFGRNSEFAPDTLTAVLDYVNLRYDVAKLGLKYRAGDSLTLRGGVDVTSVSGYHPAYNTLVAADAGTQVVDLTQTCPYPGFDWALSDSTTWTLDARLIDSIDGVTGDAISPESFSGHQLISTFQVRF